MTDIEVMDRLSARVEALEDILYEEKRWTGHADKSLEGLDLSFKFHGEYCPNEWLNCFFENEDALFFKSSYIISIADKARKLGGKGNKYCVPDDSDIAKLLKVIILKGEFSGFCFGGVDVNGDDLIGRGKRSESIKIDDDRGEVF